MNAKASADPELVQEVNDRLDVAEVQQIIAKLLRRKAEGAPNVEDYSALGTR